MSEPDVPESVVVQVVDVEQGREISWGSGVVEKLRDRVGDIQNAIVAAARAIDLNPDRLPSRQNWQVDEISATFGVTLTTEAGVILSRAGTEATFEVTVTLRRK
ncbi:CU044_2847 family protein [Plantactinospora sp. B5E13]|uniref:CU044_2847 family protein n=1 Tax=unclassified Plantactinospora TaxID=2631981 RepID=UPI00325C80D0